MTVDHFLIDVFVLSFTTSQQQNLAYSRSFSLTIYIVAEIDTISKWIKVKYVLRRVTKWNLNFSVPLTYVGLIFSREKMRDHILFI